MKTRDLIEHIFPFILVLSVIFFITYNVRAYIDKVEINCINNIDPLKTNEMLLQTNYIIASVVFFAIAKIAIIVLGLNLKSKNFERASLSLSFFNTLFIFIYLYLVYEFHKEVESTCSDNSDVTAMGSNIITYVRSAGSCVSCIFIVLIMATFITTSSEKTEVPISPEF